MSITDLMLVFRTDATITGVYDTLFGGLYRWPLIVKTLKLSVIFFYASSLLIVLRELLTKTGREWKVPRLLAVFGFVSIVLLLNHPVDELFIGLRHSMHLAESGNYSFNRLTSTEGVVDFLPYFVIGLLAKLGLPIVEMAFLQSMAGGILALLALSQMLKLAGITGAKRSLIFWAMSLFAPLVYNSTIGFANSLFTAAILWATVTLFYDDRKQFHRWGFALLAIIPIIRLEGALISAFYYLAYAGLRRPGWRAFFVNGVLIVLPLVLLSAFRQWKFGSPVPLPIPYKSTFPDRYFLLLGIRNFGLDLFSALTFQALFILGSVLLVLRRERLPVLGHYLLPLVLLIVFTIPYYLSGGDWFPSYWGRYSLPLTTYAAALTLLLLVKAYPLFNRTDKVILIAQILISLVPNVWIRPANIQLISQAKSWWAGRGNPRIQSMSQIGRHLNQTTAPSDVIASSEIATIMYHAKREALDMLGVTNPKIVREPLQQGHIYRRRNPELIPQTMPEFLWAGDHMSAELTPSSPIELVKEKMKRAEDLSLPSSIYYYGGQDKILSYGYRPVLVIYGNSFSALYFVSPKALSDHLTRLRGAGFREDPDTSHKLAQLAP